MAFDLYSSEFDPTRVVTFSGSGATLVDTVHDVIEAYDTAGRLIERTKRTGEPLFAVTYVDSASDRIAEITDPIGGATVFAYSGAGFLSTVTDPASRTTTFTVDGNGDLVQLQKPDGEVWSYQYNAHRMSQKTAPNGDVTTYTFASDGSLSTATKPAGETTTLAAAYSQPPQRDANGKTLHAGTFVDPHAVTHAFTIDALARMASDSYTANGVSYTPSWVPASILTGAGGTTYTNRNNTLGRVAYRTNNGLQLGRQSAFDAMGRRTGFAEVLAETPLLASFTYDANSFLSAYTEGPADDSFQITRDAAGHPLKIAEVGFDAREVDYTWNAQGLPATMTSHGVTTTYTYDANGNVLSTVDTLGRTTAFTYDAAGNRTSSNDGQTTTSFAYDAANRLLTSTDALGNATSYGYALPSCGCSYEDLVTSIHTPDLPTSVQWTMQYGPEGRLSSVTDPDGFPESYAYQPTGELIQTTDRNGNVTSMGYDQLGRVTSILDALNRAHARTYPVPSNTGWTGPSLLSGSASSTPATTSLTGTFNPGDYQIGQNGYDLLGNASLFEPQVTLYQDATFQLSYGLQWDQVPRLTDKEDRNGLPISSPVAFGSAGQTGPNFQELTSYNPLLAQGLPQSQESNYSDRAEDSTFSYNSEFDLTSDTGWQLYDPSATYTYARDVGGRITGITRTFLSGSSTGPAFGEVTGPASSFVYYPNGYLMTRTDADGEHDYTYDARGLVESIEVRDPTTGTLRETWTFGYDALGRNNSVTFPDGHTRVQEYDQEGRMTSRCYDYSGALPTRCYTASYDPLGNPVTLGDPEGTDTLTYDSLNRLVQVSRSTGEVETYAFNTLGALSTNAGVVLNMQRPVLSGSGTADSAVPASYNSLPVTLDGGGRITAFNGDVFVYDKRNQLRSVTEAGVTEYYAFDSFMRRIARYSSSTVDEFYVYEGDQNITEPQLALAAGQVASTRPVSTVGRTASSLIFSDQLTPQNIVATLDASGGVSKTWLYDGIDHPLRGSFGGTVVYYEVDLAGNVRRLRDTSGNDLGGYRYTAFGEAYPADAGTPAPLISQPLQWKGRWFSSLAGGIYDVRARQWSPALGAFFQVDNLLFQDRVGNLWTWGNQNPTRYVDRTGRCPACVVFLIGLGAALFLPSDTGITSPSPSPGPGAGPGPGGPGGGPGAGPGGGPGPGAGPGGGEPIPSCDQGPPESGDPCDFWQAQPGYCVYLCYSGDFEVVVNPVANDNGCPNRINRHKL